MFVKEDEYKKLYPWRASCFFMSPSRRNRPPFGISGVNRSAIFTIYLFLDLEKHGRR